MIMKKTNILTACGFAAIAALLITTHFEPFANALAMFYTLAIIMWREEKKEGAK